MSQHKSDTNLLELITAFVDGEASPDEIISLEKLRRGETKIDQAIDAEIKIRQTLRLKCRKIHAPSHLRSKCLNLIRSEYSSTATKIVDLGSQSNSDPRQIDQLNPLNGSQSDNPLISNRLMRWFIAATVLFSVGFLSGQYLTPVKPDEFSESSYRYEVEDLVQRHFVLASDVESNEIHTLHTSTEAEQYLNVRMGFDLTVPELHNATFIGAEMAEFVPGHSTPLLKYSVIGKNDPILIFAFPIDKMEGDIRLVRDIEAIEKCKSDSDTYIKDINGKHIVSWKWGNVWYVGVSNHHGEVLASMLPTSK